MTARGCQWGFANGWEAPNYFTPPRDPHTAEGTLCFAKPGNRNCYRVRFYICFLSLNVGGLVLGCIEADVFNYNYSK